ncbi:MAG: DNA polymerase III subunit beta [Lactobacillales bacterium]|jgi:DNA polymerase-3 subunit beta|nr:DNA polymerase III subunit beta [Lactobacillales bacterium]
MSLHVTLNRSAFLQSLRTTQKAIASKTTIPILTGVKVYLSQEGLSLTGSNVDISIETFIPADDEKANMQIHDVGGIIIQAKFLSDIVSRLDAPVFSMEVLENNQVKIVADKKEVLVNGIDMENYPRLPLVEQMNPLKMPVHVLTKLVSETVFSVSVHESRPILTGVHFVLNDNENLLAVATDSHRLSQRIIKLPNMAENFNIVIPGKSLKDISAVFPDEEEELEIHFMENQVLFRTDTIMYYSRLLEGNYPDTNRLIPDSFNTTVEFSVSEFRKSIDLASVMSHEGRNNIVKLEITSDGVKLYGNSPEAGKVEEELVVEKVTGDPLTISFNPDYMKDALRAFGETNIQIQFISPIRPFTLEPTETTGEFIQLITPVRTN